MQKDIDKLASIEIVSIAFTNHQWNGVAAAWDFGQRVRLINSISFTCSMLLDISEFNENAHMGLAMQKHVFGHIRTAKAQISLRIRADWSGLFLSGIRSSLHYRNYQWRANVRMKLCACAGWIWICIFYACSKTHFPLAHPLYTSLWYWFEIDSTGVGYNGFSCQYDTLRWRLHAILTH